MIDTIAEFLKQSHELTPLTFGAMVLAFMASGFVLLPRMMLCVLAGATFGLVAIPIVLPSSTLGALIAFLTARALGAKFVQRWIGRKRLLKRISDAVDHEGWRIVALVRLGAPVPGAMTNYLFGLTNIRWSAFAWASLLFSIPQVVLFVCLGAAGRAALLDDSTSVIGQTLMAIGIVTSALIVVLVAKRARSTLSELRDDSAETTDRAESKTAA